MGKPLDLPALAASKDDELDAPALLALETDRLARAYAARATLGISPAALALAFGDWWMHLAASPGKLVELQRKAARKWLRYGTWLTQNKSCASCIEPLPQDSRFVGEAWQQEGQRLGQAHRDRLIRSLETSARPARRYQRAMLLQISRALSARVRSRKCSLRRAK